MISPRLASMGFEFVDGLLPYSRGMGFVNGFRQLIAVGLRFVNPHEVEFRQLG